MSPGQTFRNSLKLSGTVFDGSFPYERADEWDLERHGRVDHPLEMRVGGAAGDRVWMQVVRVVRQRGDLEARSLQHALDPVDVERLDVDMADPCIPSLPPL